MSSNIPKPTTQSVDPVTTPVVTTDPCAAVVVSSTATTGYWMYCGHCRTPATP